MQRACLTFDQWITLLWVKENKKIRAQSNPSFMGLGFKTINCLLTHAHIAIHFETINNFRRRSCSCTKFCNEPRILHLFVFWAFVSDFIECCHKRRRIATDNNRGMKTSEFLTFFFIFFSGVRWSRRYKCRGEYFHFKYFHLFKANMQHNVISAQLDIFTKSCYTLVVIMDKKTKQILLSIYFLHLNAKYVVEAWQFSAVVYCLSQRKFT